MKQLKFFSLMLIMLLGSISLASCGGDDDEPAITYDDFYIACSVSGGGFNSQELSYLESSLNASLVDTKLQGYEKNRAIYVFDSFVNDMRDEFSDGMNVSAPLYMTFILKTTGGSTVKSTTLTITRDGCK